MQVLDGNRIKVLPATALAALRSLRELRAADNALRRLQPLGDLPSLTALHVANNRILDVADITALRPLPRLAHVTLTGNPIARTPAFRRATLGQLPHLQVRPYTAAVLASVIGGLNACCWCILRGESRPQG